MLSESGPIHDKILENDELMAKLFAFLEEPRLNATLAGYFSKVVQPLFGRNPEKAMTYFCTKGILEKLTQHMYVKSIVDILLKVLNFDSSPQEFFPTERKSLVQKVIAHLCTSSEYTVYFSGYILSEVLNKSMEINCWKELTGVIISKENLGIYFKGLVSEDPYRSTACGNVLKTLLGVYSRIDLSKHYEDLAYTRVFVDYLPSLSKKLYSSSNVMISGTNGETSEALGEGRLKLIEIVSATLRLESEGIQEAIGNSGILSEVSRLFFGMPWNSMLHNVVEGVVLGCVMSRKDSLINDMLVTSGFLDSMVRLGLTASDRHRLGVLGHINKLANYLKSVESETVRNLLGNTKDWGKFVGDYLEVRNSCESKILGDMSKKDDSSSSESNQDDPDSQPEYMKINYAHETAGKHPEGEASEENKGNEHSDDSDNSSKEFEIAGRDEEHKNDLHFTQSLEQKISEISLNEGRPDEDRMQVDEAAEHKAAHIENIGSAEHHHHHHQHKENVTEGGEANIAQGVKHTPSSPESPGHLGRSPKIDPYSSLIFWSVKIDEIDDLEPL